MNIKKVFIEHPRENFFARCPLQSHHCRLVLDAKERVKKKTHLIFSSLLNYLGVSVPQAQHMLVSLSYMIVKQGSKWR